MEVPKFDEYFNPLLKALKMLGGSGSVAEIDAKVAEIMNLSDEQLSIMHRGNRTQFSYRLAWTRNYLKRFGALENSSRGVWALTEAGLKIEELDAEEVKRTARQNNPVENEADPAEEEIQEDDPRWQDEMIQELLNMEPGSFERLCQRILRESGFIEVEVTGRSGDGGIDGRGIIRLGGLLSFHIIFQCKRYKGSVSSNEIRDFRGAMVGRTDKGLFITTGVFTRDARKEAIRDGAPPIDLIDGNDLALKMKELQLGVKVTTEEYVEVDKEWLSQF